MNKASSLHFKLYKPYGMLSQLTSNDPKEKNKKFLSELFSFPIGTMPIGRLDEKSEGLILLTTDGKMSNEINSSGVEKEYVVQLDGLITAKAIDQLCSGVEIGLDGQKYVTKPCKAIMLQEEPLLPKANSNIRIGRHRPSSWVQIVLREGKFRQIRKMTASVGFPTLRLVRIRIGMIQIGSLWEGDVEEIDL